MNLAVLGFDWDEANLEHCSKHGLTREEIESTFRGEVRVAFDVNHSTAQEARLLAIGRTASGRATFVVFTMRGGLIRTLNARYMHAKEVARYETQYP